jgi:hypothetical protein
LEPSDSRRRNNAWLQWSDRYQCKDLETMSTGSGQAAGALTCGHLLLVNHT